MGFRQVAPVKFKLSTESISGGVWRVYFEFIAGSTSGRGHGSHNPDFRKEHVGSNPTPATKMFFKGFLKT